MRLPLGPASGAGPDFRQDRLAAVGFWAAAAYAFFAFSSVAVAHLASTIFILAAFLDRGFRRRLAPDAFSAALLLITLWIVLEAIRGVGVLPHTVREQFRDAGDWLLLLGMLPMAWWVRGDTRAIGLILVLAVCGWLAGTVVKTEWPVLLEQGLQIRTGMGNKIIFNGTLAAIALLGCFLLARRWVEYWSDWRAMLPIVAAGLYALLAITLSQSRGVWLMLFLLLPLVLAAEFRTLARRQKAAMPSFVLALLVVLLVGILAGVSIKHRGTDWQGQVANILNGRDVEPAPTSISYRYHLQQYGLEKWLERPVLGWGAGSPATLIQSSGRSELQQPKFDGRMEWIDHFHNTPLEVLVRFGLVGALLFLAAGIALYLRLRAHGRRNPAQKDLVHFFQISIAGYLLASLTDFRVLHSDSRALLVLLCGLAYGLTLPSGRRAGGPS